MLCGDNEEWIVGGERAKEMYKGELKGLLGVGRSDKDLGYPHPLQ